MARPSVTWSSPALLGSTWLALAPGSSVARSPLRLSALSRSGWLSRRHRARSARTRGRDRTHLVHGVAGCRPVPRPGRIQTRAHWPEPPVTKNRYVFVTNNTTWVARNRRCRRRAACWPRPVARASRRRQRAAGPRNNGRGNTTAPWRTRTIPHQGPNASRRLEVLPAERRVVGPRWIWKSGTANR